VWGRHVSIARFIGEAVVGVWGDVSSAFARQAGGVLWRLPLFVIPAPLGQVYLRFTSLDSHRFDQHTSFLSRLTSRLETSLPRTSSDSSSDILPPSLSSRKAANTRHLPPRDLMSSKHTLLNIELSRALVTHSGTQSKFTFLQSSTIIKSRSKPPPSRSYFKISRIRQDR
jgi:hypothetical protein